MKYLFLFAAPFAISYLQAQPMSPMAGLPGSPMRMGFGSQGIGMGNAMVATPTQANAGYYNPALTAFQEKRAGSVSVGFLSLDRTLNFVSYSTPLPPSAGLSLGIINSGVSEIAGRDRDGRPTENYSTSENSFFLSFGLRIDTNLVVGISPKILYYKLFSEMASTTASFDLGAAYRLSEEFLLGACLQDVGSKYKWDSSRLYGLQGNSTIDHFPVRKRVGVSYAPLELPVLGAVELEHTASVAFLKFGAEVSLTRSFVVRAGIDHLGLTESLAARPSFGFSLQASTGGWQSFLSYVLVIEPYAPSSLHLLTVGIEFQ
ncbi:MAG: hypothetical protein WEB33_08270 [Bacteroidota bacterium]